MLGIVSISQIAYTRSGKNLTLNPPLTPAYTAVSIPYDNFYGSDTWRMTPRFTLTYGLGWTLEMPPYEKNGKQVIFVGPDNNPISTDAVPECPSNRLHWPATSTTPRLASR